MALVGQRDHRGDHLVLPALRAAGRATSRRRTWRRRDKAPAGSACARRRSPAGPGRAPARAARIRRIESALVGHRLEQALVRIFQGNGSNPGHRVHLVSFSGIHAEVETVEGSPSQSTSSGSFVRRSIASSTGDRRPRHPSGDGHSQQRRRRARSKYRTGSRTIRMTITTTIGTRNNSGETGITRRRQAGSSRRAAPKDEDRGRPSAPGTPWSGP